ncbi:MAG: DNA mismatch repair endonuclease MutL [Terriglobales bacterium]
MARIHVLPEHVANKIAAGEVVERPASVVKELLENALDAGATRIRVQVEAGGKKLIQVTDDGCGMVRDDAMLAFERHATSKIKDAEDLLAVATLGFRGEALPSIASVARLRLETRAADEDTGTVIEMNGGKLLKVEDAGLPAGTSVAVRDLFFNTPARRKFLKAESTELSHIASLVTHYALAHPERHFELHSTTNALLVAPPVATHADRIYQIFGKDTLEQLLPVAATAPLERVGLPQPPPWRREEDYQAPEPGEARLRGFVSRPEVQKLNRNSIFVFVNARLIRDRVVQHALTEAYRNILPPTVFPVVLLFLELPTGEVDVNVHPSKTEVRFRQQQFLHDFVRDTVRAALVAARPVPHFTTEITAQPSASAALSPGARPMTTNEAGPAGGDFHLAAPPQNQSFRFEAGIAVDANASVPAAALPTQSVVPSRNGCAGAIATGPDAREVPPISSLRPLGQVRDSFIVAVAGDGLWIIDQHVAHERVLFERVLKQRAGNGVEGQRLLMPLVVELTPAQLAVFTELADELRRNGFEVEPFGARTIAVKTAPAGVDAADIERLLHEVLDERQREEQATNLEAMRTRIAASIACHAAIKVNMPLDGKKMEWLVRELARTECPMTCPHGRPVLLRYSFEEIQRAFKRL